jgi:non-ribosomal peptide synthetase component F
VDVVFDLTGLASTVAPLATETAKFDLMLSLGEQRAADGVAGGISGILQYATDLFDRASAEALGERFVRLLDAVVADPERAIGTLDILGADERHTTLCVWNDTARPIGPATLLEMFAAQVTQAPDARAVVLEAQSLTYRELDARANQLARHLRALGIGPESVVGLCVSRSFDMVIGLLGILKAGGAFLPLDPTYPPERLAFML